MVVFFAGAIVDNGTHDFFVRVRERVLHRPNLVRIARAILVWHLSGVCQSVSVKIVATGCSGSQNGG